MSQFTEADSSVNRLNAAVTAFEKVLTEPEGTVVEMPIGAAQPSLAERLKRAIDAVTVKPAQAAAQASAAAQQAQAAQQSAAQSAADAANSAAATGYVDAPFPDVWAPLSDDLRLLAGIAPADTITVAGTSYPLPTKSMAFTRSTMATYFDKTGLMKVAAINEPRFEKQGLLLESAATNLYTYSEQWGVGSRVTTTNNSGDSPRGDKTMALVVEDTAGSEHYTQDRNIVLTAGTTYCYSLFVKAHTNPRNLYIRVASGSTAQSFFDPSTGDWVGNAGGADYVSRGFENIGNGIYRVWMVFTAALSQSTVIRIQLASGVTASYTGDGVSGLNVWGGQFEEGAFPTSYIKTDSAAATRTEDLWSISNANVGYQTLADKFKRTIAFEFFPKYTITTGYADVVRVPGVTNDIICRFTAANRIQSYRDGGGTPAITVTPGVLGVVGHVTSGDDCTMYYNGAPSYRVQPPSNTISKPTNISNSTGSANGKFVYHIRNFRIWHRLLSDIQIRGLR